MEVSLKKKKVLRILAAVACAIFAAIDMALPSLAPPVLKLGAPKLDPKLTLSNDNSPIANMASPAGSPGVGPTSTKAPVGTMKGYYMFGTSTFGTANDMVGVAVAA